MDLNEIINLDIYPVGDADFRASCRKTYEETGVLAMPDFVTDQAIKAIREEGEAKRDLVFASREQHTIYLSPPDPQLPSDHTRNRMVTSSKGCITDDCIADSSPLRALYDDPEFQAFLCDVLGEDAVYPYADPLSSINLHYAEKGQELGWHFDNSSFAITLMVQPPERGGQFEYVPAVRNADAGDMNYQGVADVLDGKTDVKQLSMEAGALVFFKGRNALHRVAPNEGVRTRMLAVLAYNTEPGISLSETARMTFYGRIE